MLIDFRLLCTSIFLLEVCRLSELIFLKLDYRILWEIIYNLGHNILGLYNALVHIRLTTSKTKRDIQYSKLGIQVVSRVAVSLPETKLSQQQSKNTQKQISNFSLPVHFCWISLFCSKYFAQNCLSKQSLGLNLAQYPSSLIFLTFHI